MIQISVDLPPAETMRVRLFFAITRTWLKSVTSEATAMVKHAFPIIDVDVVHHPGGPLTLDVDFRGDQPRLNRYTWVGGATKGPEGHPLDELPPHAAPLPGTSNTALAALEAVEDAIEERRRFVQEQKNWPVEHLQFFFDLDHASHPLIIRARKDLTDDEKEVRTSIIGFAGMALDKRVRARVSGGHIDTVDFSDLTTLSDLQRPFYDALIAAGGLEGLHMAFEHFACGDFYQSALGDWNIGPDSDKYLQFAEFAIACIERSVDKALWTQVLPALVTTQSLFREAFRPDYAGGPRRHVVSTQSRLTEQDRDRGLQGQVDQLIVIHEENCRQIHSDQLH